MNETYEQILAQHLQLQRDRLQDRESLQADKVQEFIRQAREAGGKMSSVPFGGLKFMGSALQEGVQTALAGKGSRRSMARMHDYYIVQRQDFVDGGI